MAKPKLYQVDQLETTLNASYSQANTAINTANTAYTQANAAYAQANTKASIGLVIALS
jgi:hypothetical protein